MATIKEKVKPKEGSFFETFKYKDLLYQLVSRDIKLKYRRSFLGYVWSILNPLLIMIIMSVVFSFLFQRNLALFPIYLLAGRTMFEFVNHSGQRALNSITDNSALLKKTYVSKFMFPLSKITAAMVDLVFSLGAMVIVMVFFSIKEGRCLFSLANFGIFIVIVEAYIFAIGFGIFLAQLHVFFRDIKYIYTAFMTALTYCSAIFYDIGMFYDKAKQQIDAGSEPFAKYLAWIIEHLNPIYIYIKQFRYFVWVPTLESSTPSWAQISGMDFILGFGFAFLMLIIGTFAFKRNQDKFILYI